MGLRIDALEPIDADVCVHLRGGEAGVAQEFPDRLQVGATVQQVCFANV